MTSSDLSLSSHSIPFNWKLFEVIQRNAMDGLCFLVPVNVPVFSFENFSFPFDMIVAALILFSLISVILSWKLISNCSNFKFSWSFVVLTVFKLSLGEGFDREQLKSRKEKSLLYSFVIGNILLVNLYQSLLISLMLNEPSMRSVKSFGELNNSGTKIFEFFEDAPVTFRKNQIHIMKTTYNLTSFTLPDNFDSSMAYLVTCNYAEQFVKSRRNHNSNGLNLNKLSEALTVNPLVYLMMKVFPLRDELKVLVRILEESGIMDKWAQDTANNIETVAKNVDNEEKTSLFFEDMKVPLIVLGVGYSSAFVIFLIEKVVHFIVGKRKLSKVNQSNESLHETTLELQEII